MSINKSIAKSAGTIGIFTFFSRVLGFIRDIVIAQIFGTGLAAQAFVVSFRIPNLMRELIGEGATNAALVPVFSEYVVRKEKKEFWSAVHTLLSIFFPLLVLITVAGIISAPWIVKIIAPGFLKDLAKFNLTVRLTRIMFPYLVLIGLTAYAMGILHTFKSFTAPALGPCLLNISLILAVLFLRFYFHEPIYALAIGVLAGGLLQLIIQLPPLYRKGFAFQHFKLQFKHPAVSKATKLLLPRAFGSIIYQLNVFLDTICASLGFIVGEGAVAALYYANRIVQFPLAIFGIALSTAILPIMSRQAARRDTGTLKDTLSFSLRNIFLIMLPSSIGLFLLSHPIIKILFQRGSFSSYSTSITSWALLFYSLGLTSYGGVKILSACFYSLQDTRTPVKVTASCLIINLVLNILLMWHLKVGGLALASSIAATINFLWLFRILEKKIGRLDRRRIGKSFLRILLAATIMGSTTNFFWNNLFLDLWGIIRLILVIILAITIFVLACFILKVEEIKSLLRWVSSLGS
jgi:putative peptidoglycan lipid II flippase